MIQKSKKWMQLTKRIFLWQALAISVVLYLFPERTNSFLNELTIKMPDGMVWTVVYGGILLINLGVGLVAPLSLIKEHYRQRGKIASRYFKLNPAWYLLSLVMLFPVYNGMTLGLFVMAFRWGWLSVFGVVLLLSLLFVWNEGNRKPASITPRRVRKAKRLRAVLIRMERILWALFALPQMIILLLTLVYPPFAYYIWAVFSTILGWGMP